jgi:membrane-bound ClpP family serine protease
MVMWIIIISLLTIGLGLILVEVIFIPGTTIVGILGLVFSAVGVYAGYSHFGTEVGHCMLAGTWLVAIASFIYSFRTGAWERFSLKSAIDSRVNEGVTATLSVGDEGILTSTLRPFGKAEFNHVVYEVKALMGYLEQGQRVKIIHIENNQIVVEPINP